MRSRHSQLLFTRIFDIATSILRLTEVAGAAPDSGNILDPASIASLTRNLLEAYDMFWYVAAERTSREESEFRQQVWRIHFHREAKAVSDALAPEYGQLWSVHEALLITAQMELSKNAVFAELSTRQQKRLLAGRHPSIGRIRNDRRKYLEAEQASAFYKYLSNHTHSHPFGVHTSAPARWDPSFGREFLLKSCLEVAARDLALATDDYIRRMRRCDGKLSADELEFLRAVPERPWTLELR